MRRWLLLFVCTGCVGGLDAHLRLSRPDAGTDGPASEVALDAPLDAGLDAPLDAGLGARLDAAISDTAVDDAATDEPDASDAAKLGE